MSARRAVAGRGFALLSALCYGASLPLARLAYEHGTDAQTVALMRYVALGSLLVAWTLAFGQRLTALTARERAASLVLGLGFCCVSLGLLLGAAHMPVSLTVLVFYTHPSLILVAVACMERRRPRAWDLVSLFLAFAGLALALDAGLAGATAAGVGFGFMAALGALASFLIIERLLPSADPVRSTTWAAAAALVAAAVVLGARGSVAFPAGAPGWSLLLAAVVLFSVAALSMFLAIRGVGSVGASMLLFLEPVTAIVIAMALLGDTLSGLQWLGAAMVVAAVAVAGRAAGDAHVEELPR